MGIDLFTAKLLMELGRDHAFAGRLMQLGRQDLLFGAPELERAAAGMDFALGSRSPTGTEAFDDVAFFGRLGFGAVESLDASGYEGASIVFDLNQPQPPMEHSGAYSAVFDGGTLEHVFNVPQALRSMVGFLEVGGLAIHMAPVHNFLEHGFYCFSPGLFRDYYEANGFEIVTCQLVRCHPRNFDRAARAHYDPRKARAGLLDRAGSLDTRAYLVFFAARKTEKSRADVVPTQSFYLDRWGEGDTGTEQRRRSLLRKWMKRTPLTRRIYEAATRERLHWTVP